jgi:hypothetical protein
VLDPFRQLSGVFFPFALAFLKMDPFCFCWHAVPRPDGAVVASLSET